MNHFFLLSCIAITTISASDSHLAQTLSHPHLRKEISKFIDNILRIIPAQQFFSFVDSAIPSHELTDKEIYTLLSNSSDTVQPRFSFYWKLQSLQHQKQVLASQAQQLLADRKNINGYVEIGTPATYFKDITQSFTCSGPVYAINDKKRPTDILQSSSWKPKTGFCSYDYFVPLNDYMPIEESAIPTASVDVVVCFIGLHHIPQEKLQNFIRSIHRILRPGGRFVLRDHDVTNSELQSIVSAAHSIFNLIVSQETIEAETQEYRNFHDIAYWIQLIEKEGFAVGQERLLQEGDPTYNTMLKFVKKAQTNQEQTEQISYQLQQSKDYSRDSIQTYLTSPEWLNVDIAQEYSSYIEHTPFYMFPYFKNIQLYWKVFGASWQAAARQKGHLAVLSSPYTLMNVFIGATMSMEFAAKGILSWPMRLAYAGEEASLLQMLVDDPSHELPSLDKRIVMRDTYSNSTLCLIEIPRYKIFLEVLKKIAHSSVVIKEIAGNKNIQIKIRYAREKQALIDSLFAHAQRYDWVLPTKIEYRYCALTISVEQLTKIVKELEHHGIELLYVHDF
ncbi:MAG: class I SAM-dependent methyltransferase [Candidatus Dependentiae bacterium]|nr:class I SAM-dependent methyltransferase [Candidatus Dependentiae bacterium]